MMIQKIKKTRSQKPRQSQKSRFVVYVEYMWLSYLLICSFYIAPVWPTGLVRSETGDPFQQSWVKISACKYNFVLSRVTLFPLGVIRLTCTYHKREPYAFS